MGWDKCDKKLGGQPPIKWEKDKEKHRLIILDEPEFITFEFRGQPRKRAVVLVYCDGETARWFMGPTVYQDLRKHRDKLHNHAVEVTRQGKPKSLDTTYGLAVKKMTTAELKYAAEFAESSADSGADSDLPF